MLNRPFEYFAEHHSGRLSNILLDQVDRVVGGVIGAFFGIVSSSMLTLLIVLMLLLISFKTTMVTLIALVTLYFTVYLLLKRRIAGHGEELTQLSGDIHTAVKETLGGIREIKMNHAEDFFSRRFERSSLPLSRLAVRSGVLEFLPNFILETLVFGGLVGVGLYFVIVADSAGMSLSFIALYGIATYRLVPALNGVFEGLSQMQHDGDAVSVVTEHFGRPPEVSPAKAMQSASRDVLARNVTFRYPNSAIDQLVGIDLEIPAGSSVCLFGESGAGKSTLLNLLAGLVLPQSGAVLCGNSSSADVSLDSWRKNVSFCSQQIFLFDGTIASNIAFGEEPHEVDLGRVRQAAELAMLGRFIEEEAADGIDSLVGEGGYALSGGQRQRVGIARALYKDADILIFDESFTGLDETNQFAILENLFALSDKTLILSTHDKAVARRCDKVVLLHDGRLVASGKYEDVVAEST
jgi:ABC-type multidrug transport system fused ATPase/permease subunit